MGQIIKREEKSIRGKFVIDGVVVTGTGKIHKVTYELMRDADYEIFEANIKIDGKDFVDTLFETIEEARKNYEKWSDDKYWL